MAVGPTLGMGRTASSPWSVGLEGNYQTEVKGGIVKRKACEKIAFVGCGMDGLNSLRLKQGFGVPGMPKSHHPLLDAEPHALRDLHATVLK